VRAEEPEPRGKTCRLTHFGRKSGKRYCVTVWFVVIDGHVWIGSLDETRSWVKNLRAAGEGEIDFGSGPRPIRCTPVESEDDFARFRAAIAAKYRFQSLLIRLRVRRHRACAFKTTPAGKGDA
jgi:deazaflavin-dependent oxidoreductase (nitroreductase family)